MKTLDEIRGRCRITEDGHWLWAGSLRPDGRANIYAPDCTNGGMSTQPGPRAVWHCKTGKAIPKGSRVFGTCDEFACCNPDHVVCMSEQEYGIWVRKQGKWQGQVRRILANRAIGRTRAKLTPELIAEIQASPETGVALAARLGLSDSTVSKARRGAAAAFAGAGMFSALIAVNDAGRRRA